MTESIHGIDHALNLEQLDADFVVAMQEAWCKKTCWGPIAGDYPANKETNPSFGNCFVTILAAWADRGFQDEIVASFVYEPGNDNPAWHFRLGIQTSEGRVLVDPTRQQFGESAEFQELTESHEMYDTVIFGSIFDPEENEQLRVRLALLLERMKTLGGYDVHHSAEDILHRLSGKFAAVRDRVLVQEEGIELGGPAPV